MRRNPFLQILFAFVFGLLSVSFARQQDTEPTGMKWVETWSTALQLFKTSNNPPLTGLSNNTIRQVVHASIGGDSLRMRFSNEFSIFPV